MKLINDKYRAILPTQEYLTDEVVMAQAWKKTHAYVRSFNWYADTLALDISALTIEENAKKWAQAIDDGEALYELELVPAAKSEPWLLDEKKGWSPKHRDSKKPPLRPLAHISIRDQTWATAAMMCLADAVESQQGRCDLSFAEARSQKVYSYGNRLLCDWNGEREAWFRWGNSETYRKFFTDYQSFLRRPLELGREVAVTKGVSEDVYVVNLDITQFFNSIDNELLIERLQKIVKKQNKPDDEAFWDRFRSLSDWRWSADSQQLAKDAGLSNRALKLGLPQGLVASGFFANAYLCNFDEALGRDIFTEIGGNKGVVLQDYCRYVDDLRLVISAENVELEDLKKLVSDYINRKLKVFAGAALQVNPTKTKVTLLQDLDNEGSMSNRIKAIQSELSGPGDRDSIESVTAILENLLVTEEADIPSNSANFPDIGLLQIVNFDHDVRPDTLKRFAANRLESIARSKRKMSAFEGIEFLREEAENELLAKKLIFAWMKDPSLGLVLRKAMEVYPDSDLFEPILNTVFNRSSFAATPKRDKISKAIMDYLLADIFRSASDFNGYFQRVDYPESLKPERLIELISRFAQKALAADKNKVFVTRQALMLLAVVNKPTPHHSAVPLLQMHLTLHRILVNDLPRYQRQQSALFEVASQITGNFDSYASLYLDFIRQRRIAVGVGLALYAKRGGPFWLALWKQLKKQQEKQLLQKFKWAEPSTPAVLKSSSQQLSRVLSSSANSFNLEHGLLKLALKLIELVDSKNEVVGQPPAAITAKLDKGSTWEELWKGAIESCSFGRNKAVDDPRFALPAWIVDDHDHQAIYWIGCILRAAVLGGADYTGTRWRESATVTYSGLKSSWYKRRMGMLHAPEALVGEYATVSQWTSELLMHCLQWPGFESTYVKNEAIAAIASTADLKKCIESRLETLNQLTCTMSDLPAIPTEIYRPKKQRETFRIVTVQQLHPSVSMFSRHGPTLNDRAARVVHREHLAAICKLTLRTLETKVKADGSHEKPYCDLIVFPEVAVHPDDEDLLKRLADKTNSIIFAGFVFTEKDGKLVNFARWLIPSYQDGKRHWIIRDQGKEHMTKPEEKMGISPHRPCQHILEVHGYGEAPFKMTGAICYDASDIKLAADLRDKTDLFVVAAYNTDVKTFDNMAAALQWHMYQHVVICNIGEYGGSTIQAPYKQHHEKVISHVHGSGQISINMADIDPLAFTRVTKTYKEVKTPPAGFRR
ncbi:reverse transcriptase domain-containing protein [Shewanella sp. FDAARGOS_354]|uniref:reverse transcriptase domain-containing protein n=1 Tax=Shewanella sp. FDAARGOS_354 TaxID=1930557 RepID=UPI000B51517B|nr:reverse transcriptase domain-containing protein [Shewanella sp. FDAARGOS_354]ASF16096.1 hypothetical protein CEQ32_14565 [Shewanella sp. FDAARGOS_354]